MALAIMLALLSIVPILMMVGHGPFSTVCSFLWYCFEQLIQIIQLLEEMNHHSSLKLRVVAMAALLFFVTKYFWPFAADLVLHVCICWLLWKRSCAPGSGKKHDNFRRLEEEEYEHALLMDRFKEEHLIWPAPNRKNICMVVEELVNQLLVVCQMLSEHSFLPQVQLAEGLNVFQAESHCEEDIVYCLLVPLKPPLGHSFHLKDSTEGDVLVRSSRLRVKLECMCTRERYLGDKLCFIHHPQEELMQKQMPSLLQHLCTRSSHLDMKKTTHWLQLTMTAACAVLSEPARYKLRVLPASRSCRLKLTNISNKPIFIELIMAVHQGTSNIYVTTQ